MRAPAGAMDKPRRPLHYEVLAIFQHKGSIKVLGSAAKAAVLLGLVACWPCIAAADEVMEFSVDETEGGAPRSRPNEAAVGAEAQLAKALGELRWGMSSKELLAVFKARLRAQYDQQSRLERDILRQDALYQEAKARYEQIKDGFVRFDEKKNGWDVSPIAAEFRRGSQESMLVVRTAESHDYYFFINDRLWKWYRELEPSSVGAAGFDGVSEMMRRQLGEVALSTLLRAEGEPSLTGLTWDIATTRVTLIQRGGAACLIFESQQTLAELATLRQHAIARVARTHSVIDEVVMDSDAQEQWRNTVDTTRSPVDQITRRKQLSARR